MKKLTTEEFIQKAKQVHSNRYDYSKVEYVSTHQNICIICPKHGEFWQRASHHLYGSKCPKCRKNKPKLTINQIINRANIIHNFKFKYNIKQKINGSYDLLEVYCFIHGWFLQRVLKHLSGHGCPTCKSSKGEILIEQWLKKQDIQFIPQKRFQDCKINILYHLIFIYLNIILALNLMANNTIKKKVNFIQKNLYKTIKSKTNTVKKTIFV